MFKYGTCSIDSLPAGPQCSWCGTFCSTACEEEVVMGACCIGPNECVVMEAQGCDGDSVFLGEDTVCEENSCGSDPGHTVIVPTMGQWGIIIAAIFIGFFAVFRLKIRSQL